MGLLIEYRKAITIRYSEDKRLGQDHHGSGGDNDGGSSADNTIVRGTLITDGKDSAGIDGCDGVGQRVGRIFSNQGICCHDSLHNNTRQRRARDLETIRRKLGEGLEYLGEGSA